MKKIALVAFVICSLIGCKNPMTTEKIEEKAEQEKLEEVMLGGEKDKHGCVVSAGYIWSEISQNCIRPFEVGYRLNPSDSSKNEDASLSAYLILDESQKKAEIYIPGEKTSLLFERNSTDTPFVNESMVVETSPNFVIKKNGAILFKTAPIVEGGIKGTDKSEP